MEDENKGGELRREEKTTRFLALWNRIHGGVQSKKGKWDPSWDIVIGSDD